MLHVLTLIKTLSFELILLTCTLITFLYITITYIKQFPLNEYYLY